MKYIRSVKEQDIRKHAENCWTTQESGEKRGSAVKWITWLKHKACVGLIPKWQSHWTMNTHLKWVKDKNEKQVMLRGRKGRVKEGSKEGEYGWSTFYIRMNTKILNLLKSP
jgi:hypothetical protein